MNDIDRDLEQLVEAGATLLDEHMPGWFYMVNPRTLNLADGFQCVLGQIYNTEFLGGPGSSDNPYQLGLDRLGVEDGEDSDDYGYSVPDIYSSLYPRLTRAWRRLIKARRAA